MNIDNSDWAEISMLRLIEDKITISTAPDVFRPFEVYNQEEIKKIVNYWVAWGNSSTNYGNTGNDSTTCEKRYKKVKIFLNSNLKKAIKEIKKLGFYYTR